MSRLDNKIAIITGGANGFGAAMVEHFVSLGAKVAFGDIATAAGEALAQRLGEDNALFIPTDVTQRDAVNALVGGCMQRFGVPDIVINNAGVTHVNSPMLTVDEAAFDRVFNVNVKSIYHMTQAVVPHMKTKGSGTILNIGSTAGIRPRPGLTWYNASKGAVNLLSKSMAVELGPFGIRVNAICPVIGETALLAQFMGVPDTPENRAKFIATIPLGRLSQPKDVAQAAAFLASDEAAFISGVEFPVDGARTV